MAEEMDLKMLTYEVIATGCNKENLGMGFLEVVENAKTISEIEVVSMIFMYFFLFQKHNSVTLMQLLVCIFKRQTNFIKKYGGGATGMYKALTVLSVFQFIKADKNVLLTIYPHRRTQIYTNFRLLTSM